ncbi:MAG: hypothetical protein ACRDZ3_18310 [Acidimicrobiia bacterium]
MDSPNTVVDQVREQARELEREPGFPAPLAEQVRASTAWMGAGDGAPDDLRFAATLLSRQATRNLEPPDVTGNRIRRVVKVAVLQLVGWYGKFLGRHLGAVGQAFARLGLAVAGRVERLEDDQRRDRVALEAELEALRARVATLEATLAQDRDPAGPAR